MTDRLPGRLPTFEQDDFFDTLLPTARATSAPPPRVLAEIPENFQFNLYWMGRMCGRLVYKREIGFWEFFEDPRVEAKLTECDHGLEGTRVPYFVESLMPESWISTEIHDYRKIVHEFDPNCADRYLSNIVIRPESRTTPIRVDVKAGSFATPGMVDAQHVFQGRVGEMFTPNEEERVNLRLASYYLFDNYAALHRSVEAPRMSGVQDKLPAHLTRDGELVDASSNAFTHIIKFPVSKDMIRRGLCAVEWFSTLLAERCGLETEQFAIAEIPGFGPVFLAERFDIREHGADRRAIMAEDFCSISGTRRYAKDGADIAAIMFGIEDYSTAPAEDLRKLLKLVMYAWLIENDDLHMKNIMLVKSYDENMRDKQSIRLAPAYDMVSTSLYTLTSEPALTVVGTRDYSLEVFQELGEHFGISREEVSETARSLCEGILAHAPAIVSDLPTMLLDHPASLADVEEVLVRITADTSRLAKTLRALEPTPDMPSAPRRRPTI